MIISGKSPPITIDLGNDEPGMTLQRFERCVWVDYLLKGQRVLSLIKIEALPPGKYRLV